MFRKLRGWFESYKEKLFESYEPPRPTIYKLGNKKYVKVKRIRTTSKTKDPYLK